MHGPAARVLTGAQHSLDARRAAMCAVLYDPSDLSSLWQDAAGTTPVTTAGDPVGLVIDKSRLGGLSARAYMAARGLTDPTTIPGVHLAQATAGNKPTWQVEGTRGSLLFDGVDDFLASSTLDLSAVDAMTAVMSLRKLGSAAAVAFEVGSFGNNIMLSVPTGAGADRIGFRFRGASGGTGGDAQLTGFGPPVSLVATMLADVSLDLATLIVNGQSNSPGGDQIGRASCRERV